MEIGLVHIQVERIHPKSSRWYGYSFIVVSLINYHPFLDNWKNEIARQAQPLYNEGTIAGEECEMANQEHVDVLRQGVENWNQWRVNHPEIMPDLSGADLSQAILTDANLTNTILTEAKLDRANLSYATLSDATLNGANLNDATLTHTRLNGTDLSDTTLIGSTLTRANLTRADLHGVDLTGAILDNANFTQAWIGWTSFSGLDLHTVRGLETVNHREPSYISIDTLYRSEGQIPESFLRQAGVPEDFLTYLPSLVNKAIEYYTCFISYTKEDEDFARRLYADLQANGVRCWFAPEHLKIGDKYQDRIFESIRLYDKLLLLLSEASVKSDWVQEEVNAALNKEVQKKCEVLFPVRLDEAVMQSQSSWADSIRETRHIGDFTHWKDHDAYQAAFQRLLRDLQSKRPQPQRKRESR